MLPLAAIKRPLPPRIRPPALEQIPATLIRPWIHLPFFIQRAALERGLRHVFQEALDAGEFDFLQGRWLAIECEDPSLRYLFSCTADRRPLIKQTGMADACIRGSLRGLVLLASQRTDPDTLFFRRWLTLEGDTELSLHTKNLLDSLDSRHWPRELQFAVRALADWMDIFVEPQS